MRALAPLSALLLLLALAVARRGADAAAAEQRIAPGVKAGGLDVGGLTVDEAAAKLQQTYGPPLYNPIAVQVAGRRFRLTPKESGLKFDTILTAKRAYHAGHANPAVDVPLATSVSKARVRTFARRVAKRGLPRAARRDDPHHAAPHLPPQVADGPLARRQGAARRDQAHAEQRHGAARASARSARS